MQSSERKTSDRPKVNIPVEDVHKTKSSKQQQQQQQLQGQKGGRRGYHSTHQHHHEDDPVTGSFINPENLEIPGSDISDQPAGQYSASSYGQEQEQQQGSSESDWQKGQYLSQEQGREGRRGEEGIEGQQQQQQQQYRQFGQYGSNIEGGQQQQRQGERQGEQQEELPLGQEEVQEKDIEKQQTLEDVGWPAEQDVGEQEGEIPFSGLQSEGGDQQADVGQLGRQEQLQRDLDLREGQQQRQELGQQGDWDKRQQLGQQQDIQGRQEGEWQQQQNLGQQNLGQQEGFGEGHIGQQYSKEQDLGQEGDREYREYRQHREKVMRDVEGVGRRLSQGQQQQEAGLEAGSSRAGQSSVPGGEDLSYRKHQGKVGVADYKDPSQWQQEWGEEGEEGQEGEREGDVRKDDDDRVHGMAREDFI